MERTGKACYTHFTPRALGTGTWLLTWANAPSTPLPSAQVGIRRQLSPGQQSQIPQLRPIPTLTAHFKIPLKLPHPSLPALDKTLKKPFFKIFFHVCAMPFSLMAGSKAFLSFASAGPWVKEPPSARKWHHCYKSQVPTVEMIFPLCGESLLHS